MQILYMILCESPLSSRWILILTIFHNLWNKAINSLKKTAGCQGLLLFAMAQMVLYFIKAANKPSFASL